MQARLSPHGERIWIVADMLLSCQTELLRTLHPRKRGSSKGPWCTRQAANHRSLYYSDAAARGARRPIEPRCLARHFFCRPITAVVVLLHTGCGKRPQLS